MSLLSFNLIGQHTTELLQDLCFLTFRVFVFWVLGLCFLNACLTTSTGIKLGNFADILMIYTSIIILTTLPGVNIKLSNQHNYKNLAMLQNSSQKKTVQKPRGVGEGNSSN